jgi:aryl-alcohol dehydrogenase-like predicted oxidoreductase
MERRRFGKTGLDVSVLGFGGAPIGFLETEAQRVERVLHQLLDQGCNVIDTAAAYAGSEEAIGRAVADRRDEYVLISKCGQAFDDLEGEAWSTKVIAQTIDRALERLRTDVIDVMLLHSCGQDVLRKGEAMGALAEARDAGKIRFAGYSGDNEAAAYACTLSDVAVLETSVNLVDQTNIQDVLPVAKRHNVGVIAKRPIANACWKELEKQPGFYSEYAKTYSKRLQYMELDPTELGVDVDDSDRAWPELALRFTLSQDVHTAIIGTTSPSHVQANIEIAAKGPLDGEAVSRIRDEFDRAQMQSGASWLGQT